jgi:hypothetical protein
MWGYIITFLITVISGVLVFMLQQEIRENRALKKEKADAECAWRTAVEDGLRQLLSVQLEEMYDKYAESDTIPRRAYSRWMKIHAAYKKLRGNGTFDHMHDELEEKHIV